ncbi:hypothetical protein AGMMS50230_00190 [Spirochaetia bacterium]|nr:hypothetical protein AGMMS50230_00190 [Spirochaetia bacterium]
MPRDSRYTAKGRVYIAEVPNTEALLKNLSASGLCIESQDFMEVVPKTRYSVDIIPEKSSKIDKFKLEIESRWVRTQKQRSESGFVIVVPPGSEKKQVLEQYLAYLSANPEPDA